MSLTTVTVAALLMAMGVALVPTAAAHDLGCVLSVHGQGLHVHLACDETQTPTCFLNTSAPSAKVESLCGDPSSVECVAVVHAPGANARYCAA